MKIDSDLHYWNLFIDHLTGIINNRMLRNIPLNTLLLDTCLVRKNKHTKAVTMNTEESEQIEKKKNQQNT